MNLARMLDLSLAPRKDHPAVIQGSRVYTFQDLDQRASAFAQYFALHGIQPGDTLALYLPNTLEFIAAYYGAQKCGAVPVSLGSLLKHDEVLHILQDSQAKVLVTTDSLLENVPQSEHLPFLVDIASESGTRGTAFEAFAVYSRRHYPAVHRDKEDMAAILYTSATTGTPKGVMLSQNNILTNLLEVIRAVRTSPKDRHLCCVPLYHVFGQNFVMNASLLAGSAIILEPKFHPQETLTTIREQKVTKVYGVPTMFEFWTTLPNITDSFATVDYCFSAAATLKPETEKKWKERTGFDIHQGYGLTECSPFASYNHWTQHKFNSIGHPIAHVRMKVASLDTLEDVPAGEPGEILIKGPNVMLGYFNNPSATQDAIRDGWLRSGDIGHVDSEGYFFVYDRVKDVIVPSGGFNVYPKEVENCLIQHPAVREAAVVGDKDDTGNEQVKAFIVRQPGVDADADTLIRFCREKMAKYKVPKLIEFTEAIPKSPVGKVLKKNLRK